MQCQPSHASSAASWLAAVLFALISAGCVATVETLGGERHRVSSDAFRAYAEGVFRDQNRVASALAFRLDEARDLDREARAALEQAESRLLDDCGELNAVAVRRRDGQRRFMADARAAATVPTCERAVVAAEQAMASYR